MQCKDLQSVLAAEGLGPLPAEAREHLAGCGNCQGFLADFQSIIAVAKTLPAEVDPPDRVWISIRAQLEAEGIIQQPVEAPETSFWREYLRLLWKPRSLATAAAAVVLIVTAISLMRIPQQKVQQQNPPSKAVVASTPAQPAAPEASPAPAQAPAPVTVRNVTPPGPRPSKVKQLAPSPSELASTTLSQTELDVSNMRLAGGNAQADASLRQNLQTLNEFIAECQQHLKQNPQDELAREYLNIALQQKADLLAAMMESGRSDQ